MIRSALTKALSQKYKYHLTITAPLPLWERVTIYLKEEADGGKLPPNAKNKAAFNAIMHEIQAGMKEGHR